jgi:membrane-bound lytic murein transglycosylase B
VEVRLHPIRTGFGLFVAVSLSTVAAGAATCGNTGDGFARWTAEMRRELAGEVRADVLGAVLGGVSYQRSTIRADRGQKSFRLGLAEFMKLRAVGIAGKGRKIVAGNPRLFASIESRFGVPPGPIVAIWGMETGFGSFMGDTPTLSAVATLAYDCRRSDYFTDQFRAALKLVEAGELSLGAIGAAHGEVGHTQFLPKNVLMFGADGDGDGRVDLIHSSADALASTANYLKGHGWQPGQGYRPGEPNFAAIAAWNAATVYEQAIAIVAADIDRR